MDHTFRNGAAPEHGAVVGLELSRNEGSVTLAAHTSPDPIWPIEWTHRPVPASAGPSDMAAAEMTKAAEALSDLGGSSAQNACKTA